MCVLCVSCANRTADRPLGKYVAKLQEYLDMGLLRPDSAVLSEAHKSFVLDCVIGLPDEDRIFFNRYLLGRGW